jgi:putative transposase
MKAISDRKKRYVLRHAVDPEMSKRRLAREMRVSKSTVHRILRDLPDYPIYELPKPKKCGRKQHVFTIEETQKALEYRQKYKASCNTLERLLRARENLKLSHNQIYKILKNHGLIHMQRKKHRRNDWVRFERKHSLSMWQADWKQLKNGNWLIAFKDDASRLITAAGEFPEATSEHSIEILVEGIKKYGRPLSILTGRDVQFYASEKNGKPGGKTKFQLFLEANGIKHILARVKHPQTCGKIERFFGEVEVRLYKWHDFKTVAEVVDWHNNLLPSLSLDYDNLETPAVAFKRKMHHNRTIIKEVVEI